MIERLVAALEQAKPDLTAEDIAEILWLTLQQWKTEQAQPIQPLTPLPGTTPLGSPLPLDQSAPVISSSSTPTAPPPKPTMAGVTIKPSPATTTSSTAPGVPNAPLALPDAPALRQSLEILKAIRPLIRLLPSTDEYYLDIPSTVKAIAETDIWVPKLEPTLEPWLELALVVDVTASMVIWQRTILGLRRVLAQSGVFRDVRLWSLEAQSVTPKALNPGVERDSPTSDTPRTEPLLCLRAGYGPFTAQQPPCLPEELLDPRSRRLIVVVSDCLAPRWETHQIRDILQAWSGRGPLALLQVLPEWLWNRTGLLQVTRGQVVNTDADQPTQALTFLRRGRRQRTPSAGIKVPVFTLELDVVARWSQMVAGRRAITAPGLLFTAAQVRELMSVKDLNPSDEANPIADLTEPPPTPAERLADFQRFSSPLARQLAGYLAACPEVNLPIIRMVQAALLPESQQVHVAEVLLGGLFRPQTTLTAETLADEVQYVFYEGVQPLVQDTVRPDYVFQTLSLWLKQRFGYSLEDFRAYVTPEQLEQVKPFAGVMLDVLKRQESQYSDLIQAIEQTYQPLTQEVKGPGAVVQADGSDPQFPPLEPVEFIEAHFEPDDGSILFPPPLQSDEFTIATATVETEPEPEQQDPDDRLEQFEFVVATLERRQKEWVIQRQRQTGYRFVESLSVGTGPGFFRGVAKRLGLGGNDPGVLGFELEMVAIPGGTFTMGSPPDEPERYDGEGPQHEVTVQPFFMGRYPITQAQWRFVAGLEQINRELKPDPSRFKGDDRPVEKVSWYEVVEFCDRLSNHTGKDYRLPTEAEWEYACRAGTTMPFHFGETISTELANCGGTPYNGGPQGQSRGETTPVEQFEVANAFGLSDMHGNVYEWCQDYSHSNYEGAPTDGSAWIEGGDPKYRVRRGGSWSVIPRICRSAFRDDYEPGFDFNDYGFRVVCSAPRALQLTTG